jgi:hypothetical protein
MPHDDCGFDRMICANNVINRVSLYPCGVKGGLMAGKVMQLPSAANWQGKTDDTSGEKCTNERDG